MLRVRVTFDYALRSLCQSRRRAALLLEGAPETRQCKLLPHERQYRERLNTKLLLLLKQVWPAHKHVCGPERAKPFNPPDLTLEEAQVLRLVGHIPMPIPEGPEDSQATGDVRMVPGPSAIQEIERIFEMEPGELEQVRLLPKEAARLRHLASTEWSDPLCVPPSSQITNETLTSWSSAVSPDKQSTAMVLLRLCLYVGTVASGRRDLYNKLGPTCFAAFLDAWLVSYAPDTPPHALALAMHRHVIFIGLLRAKSQALPDTSPITAEYLRGALERVLAPLAHYFRFENAAHAVENVNNLLGPLEAQLVECSLAVGVNFNDGASRVRAIRVVFVSDDARRGVRFG